MVIQTLYKNTDVARDAIRRLSASLTATPDCACQSALASALITNPQAVPDTTRRKLDLLVSKYLK
jgi:5'-methylthioadenosine phosphorylase